MRKAVASGHIEVVKYLRFLIDIVSNFSNQNRKGGDGIGIFLIKIVFGDESIKGKGGDGIPIYARYDDKKGYFNWGEDRVKRDISITN